MTAKEEVLATMAWTGGPTERSMGFAEAWVQQFRQPLDAGDRIDEVAAAYEAGYRAATEERSAG